MSELSERERYLEEDDNLSRSTKKYKDHHSPPLGEHETFSPPLGSYRDRLVGAIPGTQTHTTTLVFLSKKLNPPLKPYYPKTPILTRTLKLTQRRWYFSLSFSFSFVG